MALHVAVLPRPGGGFEILPTSYFEVHGPFGVSGMALAGAFAKLGHHDLWPDGNVPLGELGELPDRGMLTLTPFRRPTESASQTTGVLLVAVKGPDCGQHLSLTRGCYSIGRSDCDLRASDPALSRHHADIIVDQTHIALVRAPASSPRADQTGKKGPQFLGVGDEFVLGETTFRICPVHLQGQDARTPTRPVWPPPVTTLHATSATSRPWLTMATAFLPLAIGIVLAMTLGSWIFLAFSALGLVTGGVPATNELVNRRKMRRQIRTASTDLISKVETWVPPVGQCTLRDASPTRGARLADKLVVPPTHPLRFGSGHVLPPLNIDPATYRGPQIVPVPGPVIASVSPGGLGLLTGTGGMLGPVIRAAVLQLSWACARTNSSLVIVGRTDLLPAEARYLPGVQPCPDLAAAQTALESLPPGSVVITMPGLTDPDRIVSWARTSGDGRPGPSIILTGVDQHDTADWILDTTASTLRVGDRAVHVNLDGISRSTMADAAVAAEPEIPTGSKSPGRGGMPAGQDGSPAENGAEPVWCASSESALQCRIGQSAEATCELDFVGDGPHVLVTGTTGSGKSELLKSMTMDLLHRYGPDQLALVLLDFKGGSTLGPYAETPHCQTLVTDLNVESGERVLAGLRVELRRRESLFQDANVEDYARYRRLGSAGAPPLPRLLVIVDEFRILSDELPDAVQELMRIATIGRSLGVHLLLSTQRPQGVVTASMRANINSVISLRLLNSSDSQELLGSSVAAEIPVSTPGAGFIRRAGEQLRPFRSITVDQRNPLWKIQKIGPAFQDCHTVATLHGPVAESTSPAMELAALTSGFPSPPMPVSAFAPPLPAELHFIPGRLRRQRPDGAIALGLVDDIGNQRLAPLWWHPEKQRRLAIIAGPGSTAPAALLRVLQALATGDTERHVYLLDGTGYFSPVAQLPRVAGYVGTGEPERVSELLDVFDIGEDSASEMTATRVLLVSGLAAWSAALGASDFAALDDRLAALARSAEQRNGCLVVIGDRDLMSSRYLALAEHRLYLRFGLGPETTMSWPRLRNTAPLAGRSVWTGPGIDGQGAIVQLCTPPPSSPDTTGPAAQLPVRWCLPLPERAPAAALAHARAGRGRYPVAVIGPDNRAWVWEPGSVGMVLGGPGSGKTSLIRLLAHQLGGLLNVSQRLEPDRPAPDVLLLDDVLDLSDVHLATLDAMIRGGTHVVMSVGPERSGLMRLPAAARTLPPRAFLLLNPRQAADGDIPGWRFQPHRRERPGRAIVMLHGRLVNAQCAQVGDGEAAPR